MEKILNEILTTLKDHSKRFDSIDHEISDVKSRIGNVESRLGNVENRLGNVESRLGNVENNVDKLSKQIENNATEFRSHFKHIETKLDQHEETFHIISDTLMGTKIDIEHLSKKSGVHETEINQLKKRIHS
ncbi:MULTISPECIES: hypothetical protein [unclassified Cytobacillus]|uniref:hypothetical protein n=1 Tax=unclassified Cytobacillus TaxID=2675268 RepID=UPI002040EDDA|nr:hypothetical protein [Cytobacillus sp. AMY 15.2]MCM3092478.1 hypothetical protein [Cytobacillus sp. AMY 15.2]